MRASLLSLLLVVGCADDECNKGEFFPIDAKRTCIGPAVEACAPAMGTETTVCSIGPDGKAWLSFHGHLYPGGRACTDADKIEVFASKWGACDSDAAVEDSLSDGSDAVSDACEARVWTAPGCSVSPTCMSLPLDACGAVIEYCACDGRTITGSCGMAPAPWRFVGRCDALDAGAD